MKNALTHESTIDQLTSHQKEIFDAVTQRLRYVIETKDDDPFVVLSGPAGTGKTFLTAAIIHKLREDYSMVITAPTHKSVGVIQKHMHQNGIFNVGCATLHRFLNIRLYTDYDKGIQKFQRERHGNTVLVNTDILIVDECSMVGDELLELIQEAIDEESVKAVLFVGDYYQLPPVNGSINAIFQLPHHYKLSQIVRQAKDSYIIKIASETRDIIKTCNYEDIVKFFSRFTDTKLTFFHNHNEFLADFYSQSDWYDKDNIIAAYTNRDVTRYNQTVRREYWRQKGFDRIPNYREGDSIVFQAPYEINKNEKYLNGDVVTLASATKKHFDELDIDYWECLTHHNETIRIVDHDCIATYNNKLNRMAKIARKEKHYHKRKVMWKIFFDIKSYFADVKYTFASTIHKLQGSTYETVYVDLYNIANQTHINMDIVYRLVYVALTRASKDIKVLIPPFQTAELDALGESYQEVFGANEWYDELLEL